MRWNWWRAVLLSGQGFTDDVISVLALASQQAKKARQRIMPEHVLYALLQARRGRGVMVLTDLLKREDRVRLTEKIQELLSRKEQVETRHLELSGESQLLLREARSLARRWGNSWIGTEHLILAFCQVCSPLSELLAASGITPESYVVHLYRFIRNPPEG
jgi:ATP-dependent Clp protease ATP-binding subunit ClpA